MSDNEVNELTDERILDYLSRMTEKQFVEFFYKASASRTIKTYSWAQEHYVLALAVKEENDPWDVEVLALHDKNKYPTGWKNDAMFELGGECGECGFNVSSWAQYSVCPVCGDRITLG